MRGSKNTNPPQSSLKKGGSDSRHTEEQHLQSAECWLKTQAVCKTFQPNEDTFNANVVIGKRKYPVTNTKELSCKKDNYIEINNQLDCFGSKEPHNDDIKSVILSESERSHNREDFTNNAILRGLNNCSPQEDETKHVIVSESETTQPIYNQKPFQGKIDSLRETSCPPLVGDEFADGRSKTSPDSEQIEYTVAKQHVRNSESVEQIQDRPKSMISRRGEINCHVKENDNLSLNNFVEDIPLTCTPKVRFSSLRTASSPARGEEFLDANSNNSRKVAFTEPSRGMSGAKVEQTSAETLSFRCVCERCRLTRGDVGSKRRKVAFTLAEVLITLGIIGVVAALTLPSLISKYQKHVYYNQFLKAVSVLGNAEKLYINDYCGGDASNCYFGTDDYGNSNPNFNNDFSKYFKIIKKINKKNYEEVCSGYTKLPVSQLLDGSQRDGNACSQDWIMPYDEGADYGFITADGMMFNLGVFEGPMEGGFVDINGPDKGPNIVGRDIFHFIYYNGNRNASQKMGIFWNTETYMKTFGYGENYSCAAKYDSWFNSWTCGERLLRDGKMDY